jgi:hypothetical protein
MASSFVQSSAQNLRTAPAPAGPSWKPDAEVKAHDFGTLPADLDFFAPPPGEIGKVLTAWSELKSGKGPMSFFLRWNIAMVVAALPVALVYWLTLGNQTPRDLIAGVHILVWAIGAPIGLLFFGLALYLSRFRPVVSYVGTDGVARITAKCSIDNPQTQLLRFADASVLQFGQTRNYYNGVYTGTNYSYQFFDAARKSMLKLAGSYYSAKGIPRQKCPYWLAIAAERSWCDVLLKRKVDEFEKNGRVSFQSGKTTITLLPGAIEFKKGEQVDRLEADQLKSLQLHDGTLSIKSNEARFFGFKGKYHFSVNSVDNWGVFLLCLEQLLGVRFE